MVYYSYKESHKRKIADVHFALSNLGLIVTCPSYMCNRWVKNMLNNNNKELLCLGSMPLLDC
ncbi:Uncharacterised protein [Vibrio cholerae]|nr:Uncharacterised protein [Vibrio cholerae]